MSERKISKLFETLARKDPFFSELENRMEINAAWRKAASDFLASKTYASRGKDGVLEVWSNDSVVLAEVRFRSTELLKALSDAGMYFKKIVVKRLR